MTGSTHVLVGLVMLTPLSTALHWLETLEIDEDTYLWVGGRLPDIQTDIPETVKYVEITANDIRHLQSGDFSKLSKCEQMILDYTKIEDIEPGSFTGLESLSNLSIFANDMLEYKSEMWQGLDNLTELTLSSSLFGNSTEVHPGAFSTLPNLEILRFGYVGFRSLRGDMWLGLGNLKVLHIFNNYLLYKLEARTFQHLVNLERLLLIDNSLTEVPDGTFRGLSNVIELNLDDNYLGYSDGRIRPELWEGLTSLEKLDLSENDGIRELQPGAFSNLPKLNELVLSGIDYLETLNPDVFGRDGHPTRLLLNLRRAALFCDEKLCWIKEAEADGWLTLKYTPGCWRRKWDDVPAYCTQQ